MNENRPGTLWITMVQAGLLGVVAGLSGYLLLTTVLQAPASAQGSGPGAFQGPPPFGQSLIATDVKANTQKLYSFEAFETGTNGEQRSLKAFVEKRRALLM